MTMDREIEKVDTSVNWIKGDPYLQLELIIREIEKQKKFKMIFPRIDLSHIFYALRRFNSYTQDINLYERPEIILPLRSDEQGKICIIIDLTPPKEMTMKEVEAALGYKVKIKAEEG